MTADDFRRIALSMDGAIESAHMNHPDFRVRGKIFATLASPNEAWGMVKLSPEQQRAFIESDPAAFVPVKGGWGEGGATNVLLSAAREDMVHEAMLAACGNIPQKAIAKRAPKKR